MFVLLSWLYLKVAFLSVHNMAARSVQATRVLVLEERIHRLSSAPRRAKEILFQRPQPRYSLASFAPLESHAWFQSNYYGPSEWTLLISFSGLRNTLGAEDEVFTFRLQT